MLQPHLPELCKNSIRCVVPPMALAAADLCERLPFLMTDPVVALISCSLCSPTEGFSTDGWVMRSEYPALLTSHAPHVLRLLRARRIPSSEYNASICPLNATAVSASALRFVSPASFKCFLSFHSLTILQRSASMGLAS